MDVSRIMRWRTTAKTWSHKIVALLLQEAAAARNDDERWLAGYEAQSYMVAVLGQAEMLVPLLHEDQVDEVERYAKDLARAVRVHRLSGKLAHVKGRTPEEAESFLAKARALVT